MKRVEENTEEKRKQISLQSTVELSKKFSKAKFHSSEVYFPPSFMSGNENIKKIESFTHVLLHFYTV
jgi:hypothetical protein